MEALDLFEDLVIEAPSTEGIKYAGSKQKLLPHILSLARKVSPETVLDAFAGTTRVSQAFAQTGYTVVANDVAAWSAVFASCYLLNQHSKAHYAPLIEHLNSLPPVDGWFTEHYGGDPGNGCSVGLDGLKKPWQRQNTQRLDAIRTEIDQLQVSAIERTVLLTNLIRALDEVDSTLGHYASYLNEWSPSSFKQLHLKVPSLLPKTAPHSVHQRDIFDLIPSVEVDLAYLDPPYGSNNEKMPPSRVRYASYYHLWTTVIIDDEPEVFGAANRRADSRDKVAASIFEEFRKDDEGNFIAVSAIHRLLQEISAKHVILSYSSGGRATAENLRDAIKSVGRIIGIKEVDYKKNVMAGMRWTDEWVPVVDTQNIEYLFLIEKA